MMRLTITAIYYSSLFFCSNINGCDIFKQKKVTCQAMCFMNDESIQSTKFIGIKSMKVDIHEDKSDDNSKFT